MSNLQEPLPTPKPKLSQRSEQLNSQSEPIELQIEEAQGVQSQSVQSQSEEIQEKTNIVEKSTIRICEPIKEHDNKFELIDAVCDLLPYEECELTIKPKRDDIIISFNYVIACDDQEFKIYHYMKPIKDNKPVILLKNESEMKRDIQILCTLMYN